MKGAKMIVESLRKNGVKHIFGYPGGSLIPLFDELLEEDSGIQNILVRHEQGAAHAADGYARALGKPGVCVGTSGPGAMNLVTGIATAYMDSVPMIAMGGQVPTSMIGKDAFQEADMIGTTMSITKYNFLLRDPSEIAETFAKAFALATTGRPGPVYIDMPSDVQKSEGEFNYPDKVDLGGHNPKYEPDMEKIKEAADLLLQAERPLILAGGGTIISGCSDEIANVAELLGAPVATTIMGKGIIPETHPLAIGVVGMHGKKSANKAIIESDVLLAVGCRFSDRVTAWDIDEFEHGKKIVHIDIDSAEHNKNVKVRVPIVSDAKNGMRALYAVLKEKIKSGKETEWTKRAKQLVRECNCVKDVKENPIKPVKVLTELQRILRPEDIVVTGVGQHQMFAFHFLQMQKPRTFLSSGGLGTMGFGLPAGIGAKFAKPDSNVFVVDGDGSFTMTCQELATAKENGVKVIPIIMNNSYLGMVRQWLELFFGKRYANVHLGEGPDFVKMAETFRLSGRRVESHDEIAPALKEALSAEGTFVIDVAIEKESNILPMVAPGKGLSSFFGPCIKGPFIKR